MKKSYYLFNPGILSRKDNTLKFTPVDEHGEEGQPKYLPVEGVNNLFVFGSLQVNSALLNFLGKHHINVHFFDYYEHYTGSFMAKDYLLAGKMQVEQTKCYLHAKKRQEVAIKILEGASANMLKNLRYYHNRGKDTSASSELIETYSQQLALTTDIASLMGIEGNIRMAYYQAFETIIDGFSMGNREKQPPSNEVNALISFGNMLCYALCLDQLYHTQLNPTISFLHEPGARRYSLALDLAEIFKPMLTDRLIFSVLNKKMLQKNDFEQKLNGVYLKESGRKKFTQQWENKINETIQHRSLKRNVSYKHLVKLEAYKLSKHFLGIAPYSPFKMWW